MPREFILPVKEGDVAPLFTGKTNGGKVVSLAEFGGRNVVLYFYPRDDTPGCTMEACHFRDQYTDFTKKDIIVLGISADSVASHDKFVKKYELPFPLISDDDKSIANAYGAWGQKSFMGRKYMGMHRITFLIGPDGHIRKIWREVKPRAHAAEVYDAAVGK